MTGFSVYACELLYDTRTPHKLYIVAKILKGFYIVCVPYVVVLCLL